MIPANSFWIHFTLLPAFSPMILTSSVSHLYQICFHLKNMMQTVPSSRNALPVTGALFHHFQLRGCPFQNVFPELTMKLPQHFPTCILFFPHTQISGDSLDLLWAFHLSSLWPEHLPTLLCNCLLIQATLAQPSARQQTRGYWNLQELFFSHPCICLLCLRMFRSSLSLFLKKNKQASKQKHSASFCNTSRIQQMLSTCCLPLSLQGQR